MVDKELKVSFDFNGNYFINQPKVMDADCVNEMCDSDDFLEFIESSMIK